jgi:hypothetical protein
VVSQQILSVSQIPSSGEYGYVIDTSGKGFNGQQPLFNVYNAYEYIGPYPLGTGITYTLLCYLLGETLCATVQQGYSSNTQLNMGVQFHMPTTLLTDVTYAINTLTVYPQYNSSTKEITVTTNTYTTNYNTKIPQTLSSTLQTLNLANIFPRCQYYNLTFSDKDSEPSRNVVFSPALETGVTYYVFTSFYYNIPGGTGGTYNIYEAANSATPIVVSNQTNTGFTVTFTKTTGDTWNGGITCLVIFS